MAGKIFVNYRRDDTRSDAARIRDRLAAAFGKQNVFMDVDNLLAGQRFDQQLAKALDGCDVFLAVIGARWQQTLYERAQAGGRDYVREEIAQALARGIIVIPVLMEKTPLPPEDWLPADLKPLVMHQKHDVFHDRFGRDVDALVDAIKAARKARGPAGRTSGGIAKVAAAVVMAGLLAAGGYAAYSRLPAPQSVEQATASATPQIDPASRPGTDVATPSDRAREAAEKAEAAVKAQAEADAKAKAEAEARDAEQKRVAMLAEEEAKQKAAEEVRKKVDPALSVAPGSGKSFRDCPDVCPEMVVVPAGTFMMGASKADLEFAGNDAGPQTTETPQHKITIAKPFAVGKFEVTRDQFDQFVKDTGFNLPEQCMIYTNHWGPRAGNFRSPGFAQSGDHPAVCISKNSANAYIQWLSARSGKKYRLPSEAEWEYAARGTTSTLFNTGNKITASQAQFSEEYGSAKRTVAVGSFAPNAFGLFDMHGNAEEWVEDVITGNYSQAPRDGSADRSGKTTYVLRGGSWYGEMRGLRSAERHWFTIGLMEFNTFGFRVARSLD